MPCNLNQRRLAEFVKEGIRAAGGTPMEFNTIAVSDGVSMGTEGMKASLDQPRGHRRLDRARRPGPPVRRHRVPRRLRQDDPGRRDGARAARDPRPRPLQRHDLPGHVQGPAGRHRHACTRRSAPTGPARSRLEELYEVENGACPGAGACGGQFTANTMATVVRVPGPLARAGLNGDPRRGPGEGRGRAAGRRARDDASSTTTSARPTSSPANSLENAIASVSATGGTTNAALHLPAIAAEFGMTLTLDEFAEVADRTPLIADMRPGGRYAAADMYDAGGVGLVMRELLKAGPAPRRRDDRRRADDREDRRRHRRDAGPAGRPPDRDADQADRRAHDPQGQPRARGCVVKLAGARAAPPPRPGARVRLRVRRATRRSASAGSSRATSSSSATRVRSAARACRRCSASRARSSARASASRSRCSPTAASRAAPAG